VLYLKTIDELAVIINNINYAYDADVTVSGIRKLVEFAERYGMDEVAIATDICIKKYKANEFFYRIGGVLYNRSLPTKDIEIKE
jgi:hypothetical protein